MKLRKLFTFLVLNLLLVSCNETTSNSFSVNGNEMVYISCLRSIPTDIVKQDSYIETIKETFNDVLDRDDVNIITHDFKMNETGFKQINYEVDNQNEYTKDNVSNKQMNISKHNRSYAYNLHESSQPYRSVGLVKSTFYNVKTSVDPLTYSTYTFYSSAFLVNKDVVITNSDAILKNLNYSGEDDYRFADKVEIDFGLNLIGESTINKKSSFDESVEVKLAYIDKETYNDKNSKYDFAVLSIDKSLPKYTTKFNILTDWYDESVNDDEGLFVVGFQNYSDNVGSNYNNMNQQINLKTVSNGSKTFSLNNLQESGTYIGSPAMYIGDDGAFNLCGIVNDAHDKTKVEVRKFNDLILGCIDDILE